MSEPTADTDTATATATARFEAQRGLLIAIAYRMLGSVAEAEDIVQEAWLRWQSVDPSEIESDRAWLSRVVTRLCIDQKKSGHKTRETYVGPWLPEPLRTDDGVVEPESISLAFLVLLESLSPLERAVFLLHEVFDYSHAEVAAIVGQSEPACRQTFHRAKEHLRARRPRFAGSRESHQRLLGAFALAAGSGDLGGLQAMLADDVAFYSDGGGKVTCARKVVTGCDRVSRFLIGVTKKAVAGASHELVDVNGWPAIVTRLCGRPYAILTLECDDERIYAIRMVMNPDKLRHFA